jgi:hypothetical protein
MAEVFLMKAINPKKLKEDAFRLEFLTMMHEMERGIKKDFQKTTKTWNTKVEFTSIISLKGGPSVLVGTDNEIYNMVDKGTKAHVIAPKTKKYLAYQVQFVSKSLPGVISSRPGGKSGKYTYRGVVNHPGFAARDFEKTITKMWKDKYKRRAEEAMRIAAQKSGHGVR